MMLWVSLISVVVRQSRPFKKKVISVKDQLKPWLAPAIKFSIKKRHPYFSLYKQNKMSKHEYNSFRQRINNEIRYAIKDYYHKLFLNIKKDVEQTWITINKVLKTKASNKMVIPNHSCCRVCCRGSAIAS